jgi:hypothetical protein
MKDDAVFNAQLEDNLWNTSNNAIICGTIVFAGFNEKNTKIEAGGCSLTEEQISYCLDFIDKQEA